MVLLLVTEYRSSQRGGNDDVRAAAPNTAKLCYAIWYFVSASFFILFHKHYWQNLQAKISCQILS